jgi:hypothetical protein
MFLTGLPTTNGQVLWHTADGGSAWHEVWPGVTDVHARRTPQ